MGLHLFSKTKPRRRRVLAANVRQDERHDPLPLKIVLVALLVGLLVVVGWGLSKGLRWSMRALYTQNQDYRVLTVRAASDGILKPNQLIDFAEIPPETGLFSLDLAQVRARLEQIPLVKRVEIQRRVPSTLLIRVQERVPIARLGRDRNGLYYIIDREGRLLGVREKASHLPMLLGVPLRQPRPGQLIDEPRLADGLYLLEVVSNKKLSNILPVSGVSIASGEYLDVRLKDGPAIWLPRKGLDDAIDRAAAILQREHEVRNVKSFYNFTTGTNIIAR